MSSSFSVGSRAIQPLVVTDFETSRDVNTVFNPVIGGGTVANARPASLRKGSMNAIFADIGGALDLDNMLSGTAPVTWSDTDLPNLSLRFLADQDIRITQGDDLVTINGADVYLWSVQFSYQEVTS